MKQTPHLDDFDRFIFFYNVIKSKLTEAQEHLKKLEYYKSTPELFSVNTLSYITDVHEEQSDFITIVYTKCAAWRTQQRTLTQLNTINDLNKMTQRLENMVFHILFLLEQIQKQRALRLHEHDMGGMLEGSPHALGS